MILFNSNWSKDPFFTDSDGEFLISRNGKKYLDTWLGSGTLIFGHKPEFLSKSNMSLLPDGVMIPSGMKKNIKDRVNFDIGGMGIQTSGS